MLSTVLLKAPSQAAEVTQLSRALAALSQDPSSTPGNQMMAHDHLSIQDPMSSSAKRVHVQIQHAYT